MEKSLPNRSPVPPDACNLAKSFALIGDRWSLLLLRAALYGVRRFEDFQVELNIPRTVLSNRLVQLTEKGFLEKRPYKIPGSRPRPEYWLTPMGLALRLPFIALTQWGDRWVGGDKPPPMTIRSSKDGEGREVPITRQSVNFETS
jgi:DNA-binding HxlR family transcriptional regulator